jgi:hypothetical protein
MRCGKTLKQIAKEVGSQLNYQLFPESRGVITLELCFLGRFKINFDGRPVQGFSNPKSQSSKNRLLNGSFPSHWSQQQNATINHSIHDYTIAILFMTTSLV